MLRSRGIGAELLDAHLLGLSMQETLKKFVGAYCNTPLLGVHLVYLWEKTEEVFNLLSQLRRHNKKLHINLYGYYPTFAYREILQRFPFVDSVTLGEPEHPFLELAQALIGPTVAPTGASRVIARGEAPKSRQGGRQKTTLKLPLDPSQAGFASGEQSDPKGHCEGRSTSGGEAISYPLGSLLRSARNFGFASLAMTSQAICLDGQRGSPDLSHIKGIAFKKGEEIIANYRDEYVDPDSLPFPDRSLLPLYQEKGLATYLLGSRGCYRRCTFCYVSPFNGSWRGRSPENLFEELCDLYNKGVRYFYFADANFFGPGRAGKERAKRLADIILKEGLNIRFGMECRVNDLEKDSLSRLVAAGLREVFLGVESACNHTLKKFRKGTTQEVNSRAIALLRHFGIEPNLGFIMFEPQTTLEDVRANLEFLKDNKLLRSPAITAHLLSHKQTLFKGTSDYHKRREKRCRDRASALSNQNEYEAPYKFKDPKVQSFYEVVSLLCQNVLSTLTPEEANSCCTTPDKKGTLQKINNVLIETYEKILSVFEALKCQSNGEGYKEAKTLSTEALRTITLLYHEKRH
jgi:radical SAM superfamily enzyme YgiQ (UPF0313 family)